MWLSLYECVHSGIHVYLGVYTHEHICIQAIPMWVNNHVFTLEEHIYVHSHVIPVHIYVSVVAYLSMHMPRNMCGSIVT